MNLLVPLMLLTLLIADAAAEERFSVHVGVSHSWISGVRTYGAAGATRSSTENRPTPSIELAYRPITMFRLILGYTYLGGLTARRVAPNSDIFGEGGIVLPVQTPYRIREQIHQLSLIPAITLPFADRWNLDLGPSLDVFLSRATVAGRHFSETDYRAGARAMLEHRFADSWKVGLHYRYAAPPSRHVNSLEVGVTFEF